MCFVSNSYELLYQAALGIVFHHMPFFHYYISFFIEPTCNVLSIITDWVVIRNVTEEKPYTLGIFLIYLFNCKNVYNLFQ